MAGLFDPTIARTGIYSTSYSARTMADTAAKNAASDAETAAKNATEAVNNKAMAARAEYIKASKTDNLALQMNDFLQIMIAQFQNQDMDNPASTTDMMNQLMQMSTIQAMATMTDAMTMSYAASLVGKTVTIGETNEQTKKFEEIVGQVTATATEDGEQVVFVNGKSYKVSKIMAVGELPKIEAEGKVEAADDEKTEGATGTTTDPASGKTEGAAGTSSEDKSGTTSAGLFP